MYLIVFVGLVTSATAQQSALGKRQPGPHPVSQTLINPLELTSENLSLGRTTFYRMCVTCHGMDGKGQTNISQFLTAKPSDFTISDFRYGQTDRELFTLIQSGTDNGMIGFKETLEEDQIWQLVYYIRSFGSERSEDVVVEADPVLENPIESSNASVLRGKQLYARFCVKCHGANGKGDTEMREFLKTKPSDLSNGRWTFGSLDGEIFKVIKEGTDSDMESFADRLVDERIWHVVNYLKTLGPQY